MCNILDKNYNSYLHVCCVYYICAGITKNVFSDFIQYIELSMTLLMARFH